LKRISYNKVDGLLKELILFFSSLLFFLFFTTFLVAQEFKHTEVVSEGRAVIIEGDIETAKKRALDDALYMASLQAGAKVDGYSSVNTNTSLNENILIRPSSSIKDFVIIEEKEDSTHFLVKIRAFLVSVNETQNCDAREQINLSYLRPYFRVSSSLPAYSQKFPSIISSNIYKNLKEFKNLNLRDLTGFDFNPKILANKPLELDYASLVEGEGDSIKSGEFGLHPIININRGKGRLTRFSDELIINLKLNIYEGPRLNLIDSLNYTFSIYLGNETGYSHVDAFYRVPYDKITSLISKSLSKIQFRVIDQLKCHPLEAKAEIVKGVLTVPIGINHGLEIGNVGYVSNRNINHSMNDWVAVTVKKTSGNFSILDILNPSNKKEDLNGKIIRFTN
jgi:hypothetical protein